MMARRTIGVVCLVLLAGSAFAQQTVPPGDGPQASGKVEVSEREAQFAKMLTGATMHGFFTITGGPAGDAPPKLRGEQYDMVEVRKVDDGHWLFKARIRYGDHDVTLPMTLPVEWAGDTPVIVVDNLGFPGLGTYSARVLFHNGHYAGHWSGGDHGGHLFGTIERSKADSGDDESE